MSASIAISNHDKMAIGKEETTRGPPTDFSEQPTRSVKRKRQFYITEEQKRGRWIPGKRYMPLLIVQWVWHPFAVLIAEFKAMKKEEAAKNQVANRPHYSYESKSDPWWKKNNDDHGASVIGARNNGDLFME